MKTSERTQNQGKMKKLAKNKNKKTIKIKFKDNKSKAKKHKMKFVSEPPKKEKVMIVAQELKFARLLAGNEKKSRDKVLKTLKKWLDNCFVKGYEFKEEDFIRIWRGLFYAVWMSDKPLIQEELCDNISSLLDQFPVERSGDAMLLAGAGLRVLAQEWYGIDQHRMDKFLMLVRRYLRGALRCLHRAEWAMDACIAFTDMLSNENGILADKTPSYARNALSLILHISDCFLEEVAKVSEGTLPDASLVQLLTPFARQMRVASDARVAAAARRVVTQLARMYAPAREGEERRSAWTRMGCPEGGPDALELASDDDDDDQQDGEDDDDGPKALDPRAGRVDVLLPLLAPAASLVRAMLERELKPAVGKARTRLKACVERFKKIEENKFPFPDRDIAALMEMGAERAEGATGATGAKEAAEALKKFEEEALRDETKEALKTLSRRQRKRLLAKARSGVGIADELAALRATAVTANGEWNVEETEPEIKTDKKQKKRKNSEETQENESPKKLKLVVKSPKTKKNKENTINNEQNVKSHKNEKKVESAKSAGSPKQEKKIAISKNLVSPKQDKKNDISKSPKKPDAEKVKETKPKEEKKYGKPDKVKLVVKPKSPKREEEKINIHTPKKVKFVLKNNSMQNPIDYFKSVRQSPNIPFDGTKKPSKTNLKPNSTPSPINPFFKKKMRLRM